MVGFNLVSFILDLWKSCLATWFHEKDILLSYWNSILMFVFIDIQLCYKVSVFPSPKSVFRACLLNLGLTVETGFLESLS